MLPRIVWKRKISILFAMVIFFISGCVKQDKLPGRINNPYFSGYKEIPGVTEEEIRDIEALKASYSSFVFGANPSTEAFFKEDGSPGGYSAFCMKRLEDLFGIPFTLGIYEWGDLWDGLKNHTIDFSGELTATYERRKEFFMSEAIAERSIKIMRLMGCEPLDRVARGRPLVYCFLDGTTTSNDVRPFLYGPFNFCFVDDYDEVYRLLKTGEADAFFEESPAEAAFDSYGDVFAEDFFPLIYSQVSLTTGNPALAPIITVVDKYLKAGGLRELAGYYSQGYREYQEHKLYTQFSSEERQYIQGILAQGGEISIFAESDNYPVSFWNEQEGEWQGIAHDVLREIEKLSGLKFVPKNLKNEDRSVMLRQLEAGEGSLILDLAKTEERIGHFIWPDEPYAEDNFALISKNEYPNLSINEVLYSRVGLISGSAHSRVFNEWFPRHTNISVFQRYHDAATALQNGTIDLLMANQNFALYITNYLEIPGYKTNIIFDRYNGSFFGFNVKEELLCSIISKAQKLVDTRTIGNHWTRRIFDYRGKLARAQIPWLGGSLALFAIVLVLLSVLLVRNKNEGKRLESIIRQRTEDLRAQTVEAQLASRAKGEFLAHMSHELRTPINAIIGMSHIARKYARSEKTISSIDEISTASNHLLGILNDILDVSKIESGKFALIHEPFSLREALNEVTQIISMKCKEKYIRFVSSFSDIPDLAVLGDKLRLKQILINLLGNAVKFTPERGKVELLCEENRNDGKELFITFSVIDTGIGMTEDQLKKLFIPFEQTDVNIAVRFGGTGLGLVISQDLANQMGGKITVTSKPGEGSVFSFTIGLDITEPILASRQIPEDFVPDLEGKRILLVDDIEINRIIVKEYLVETKAEIVEAVDGVEAVDIFSASEPGYFDIVFMDVQMPNMNGYEAAEHIRDKEKERCVQGIPFDPVPMYAMTANAYREDIDKAIISGMNGHIAKPVDLKIILKVLDENFPAQ